MTSIADQAAVKEYIAKYQLEDELSAAVNIAIKQNSDNPFKVISEYLKTLSNDDDEDEEDDIIQEAEEEKIPTTKPRGRRAQVMSVKVDIPANFKPPVYPKAPEVEAWLAEVMEENKLMKMLSPSDRKQLMLALKEVSFNKGDTIIKQGDPGDNFYILDKGAPALATPPLWRGRSPTVRPLTPRARGTASCSNAPHDPHPPLHSPCVPDACRRMRY